MSPSKIVVIGGGFAGVKYSKILRRKLPRDKYQIVIFIGTVTHGMVPGLADQAFPLKTIDDAMTLRAHAIQQSEKAEVYDDAARKGWYLFAHFEITQAASSSPRQDDETARNEYLATLAHCL